MLHLLSALHGSDHCAALGAILLLGIVAGAKPSLCRLALTCCTLLQCGLVPDASIGMGNNGVGCFQTGTDVTLGVCLLAV